jgi:hypothetical protein
MRLSYNIASPAERLADGVVQSVNVVLAVVRCVALGVLVDTSGNDVCRTRCRQPTSLPGSPSSGDHLARYAATSTSRPAPLSH